MIVRRKIRHVTSLPRRTALVALLAFGLVQGCFRRGGSVDDQPDQLVTIHVTNHNFLDHNIFVVYSGARTRLGSVTGNSSFEIDLPVRRLGMNGEFRLRAEGIGSLRTFTTDVLHVFGGETVELTLEAEINQSSYAIRS